MFPATSTGALRSHDVSYITVDDEQARIIAEGKQNVEVRDRNGNLLGFVAHGFTDEDIAIAKRRMASDQPRMTTAQLLEHLQSLERDCA